MLRVFFLVACVWSARAWDTAKLFRPVPGITNSLVNLGKMDIAFYINGRPQDFKPESANPLLSSTTAGEEPCPCSGLKYFKDSSRSHPAEILSKLLHNNDLFSYREPTVSTLCCDSHEQVREDSIIYEFGPQQRQMVSSPLQPKHFPLPLLLDSLLAGKQGQSLSPLKQKVVELFIFPNKKETTLDLKKIVKKNSINKDGIMAVGDKEIRNDFKTMKFLPPQPQPPSPSVKKDLTIQEIKSKQDDKKQEEVKSLSNTNLI